MQEFERKEHRLKARAATNLSFLHHLEGEQAAADRYAQLAVATDRYSAQALVNKVGVALTHPQGGVCHPAVLPRRAARPQLPRTGRLPLHS